MIIGNNFNRNPNQNFENSNFNKQNRNNSLNQNNSSSQNNNFSNNLLTKDISSFKYANIENKTEVYDKSLAILHDRLKNKSITLDEFNRKCKELANKRNH